MIDALFSSPNYVGAKKMLDVAVVRHSAIARNLANLETPHYRRVDVDPNFTAELQKAIGSAQTSQIQDLKPSLSVDTKAIASNRDGNTVHLEQELLNLSENTMQHALETQLISGSLAKLRLAITGRPS